MVDTLSRNFDGDPNSNKDMQKFCSGIDQLREIGITVVIVHHTGHANKDRERSASNLQDSADTSILCEKTAPLRCRLTCKKQKDSDEFKPYRLAGKVVNVGAFSKAEDLEPTSITFNFGGLDSDIYQQEKEEESLARFEDLAKYLSENDSQAITTGELCALTKIPNRTIQRLLTNAFNDLLVGRIGTKNTGFKWYKFATM